MSPLLGRSMICMGIVMVMRLLGGYLVIWVKVTQGLRDLFGNSVSLLGASINCFDTLPLFMLNIHRFFIPSEPQRSAPRTSRDHIY